MQVAPDSLTVLVILQFREFKGLICLDFGSEVKIRVELKSFFNRARLGFGISLNIVYGIPRLIFEISFIFLGDTLMVFKYT